MNRLECAKALTAAGYILVPLRGKAPCCRPGCPQPHKGCGDGWEKTSYGQWTPEEIATGNYGVALGNGDLIIDVDPRHFTPSDDPLARLKADLNTDFPTFKVLTGREDGGGHIYLRKPADLAIRHKLKEYPGLEFRSCGQQMVGPGSLHPQTGKAYTVVESAPADIMDAPAALLEKLKAEIPAFSGNGKGTGSFHADEDTRQRYEFYLREVAPTSGSFVVACKGRDLGLPPEIVHDLMLKAWNPRRAAPRTADELRMKVANAYTYASGPVGAAHPAAVFEPIKETTTVKVKGEDWEEDWVYTPQGKIVKCLKNTIKYLQCPRYGLAGIFGYNEFTSRIEFTGLAPWHPASSLIKNRPVADSDYHLLRGYLSMRCGYETTEQDILAAITNVSHDKRFHPVKVYLSSLRWDEIPRIDYWLRDHLGVKDTPYSRACARKVLCAAVMRVLHPAIKFDNVLVLEGPGDLGKSTTVEILGGEWATDAPVDPHSRDTVDMMQGRWIIELAEMEVMRRSERESLKAFITRKTDLARLAYGRKTAEYKRQSIFIATKNPEADGTYLQDEAGNLRRWWPVQCHPKTATGQIDFKGLKASRDQLWAEAYAKASTEKLYMETAALKREANVEANHRQAEHEWTERISEWVSRQERPFITGREVFTEALGGTDAHFDRKAALGIAKVFRCLGWNYGLKWKGDRMVRGFWQTERKKSSILEALDKSMGSL